jgi:hypothetical protein
MINHEESLVRLRLRIAGILLIRQALTWLTVWAFLWGTVVLVLRLAAGTSPLQLLWGLAGVPALIGLAALPALRRLPAPAVLRAALDRASGCGGLLMTAGERELDGWQPTLPPPARLRVRWHGGRTWAFFAVGVLFHLAALLFPERLAALGPGRTLEIDNEVQKLAAQIDLLKEEAILEPPRAESLKEKLGQLKEDSSAKDPIKTLEALDHLQNVVTRSAQEAAEGAVGKTEDLAKAEALAEGLSRAGAKADPRLRAEAQAELAALVQKAAAENAALGELLDAATLEAARTGKLNPEDMERLARALRGGKRDLAKMVEKLCAARLIDPEILKRCEGAGECDGSALAEMLKSQEGKGRKMSVGEMLSRCQGRGEGKVKEGSPGRGGLTEGPGAAALTWGEKTKEEGFTFKEQALPPAAVRELKKSRLAGLGQEAPPTEKRAGPSASGALGQAAAGGGSATTQVILPRHRATVERYFERPPRK